MRCTLNLSPFGHITLFLVLQYGQMDTRSTSFPSPVDPTTRIPRSHFVHRKIFCTCPPCLTRRNLGSELLLQCAAGSAAGCNPCCGTSCVPRVSGSIFMR